MGGRYRPGNGMVTAMLTAVFSLFCVTGLFERIVNNQDQMLSAIAAPGLIVAAVIGVAVARFIYRRLVEKYGESQAKSIDYKVHWISIAVFLAVMSITFKKLGIWFPS